MRESKILVHKVKNIERFHALDAFRGLAAILIVLFHSQFYSSSEPNLFIRHSDIFVDFFFVLSGFVIAYSYQSKILEGLEFRKFILLRFGRLYPLHLFMLLVWVPYIGVKIYLYQKGIGATDPTGVNNIVTFIKNLFLLQGMGSQLSWNYPSWSIGSEFYTYILFFTVLMYSGNISRTKQVFIFMLAVAFLSYVVANSNYIEEIRFVGLFRCISEFFFGVLVYYLYKNVSFKIHTVFMASLLEILLLLVMIYFVDHISDDNHYKHYTVAVFIGMVYLFAIQNIGYISRIVSIRIFQYLGKISYSIYMTHAIIVTGTYNVMIYLFNLEKGRVEGVSPGVIVEYALMLDTLLVFIVIGISTLTYKYIEVPFQNYFKQKVYK